MSQSEEGANLASQTKKDQSLEPYYKESLGKLRRNQQWPLKHSVRAYSATERFGHSS